MNVEEILRTITYQTGITFVKIRPVSGGDIGASYKLTSTSETFFLKIYSGQNGRAMANAEKTGLNAIATTNTINTPKIIYNGCYEELAYLLMEFIEPKRPEKEDFIELGKQLAQLHQTSNDIFGFKADNFIGRLHQENLKTKEWQDFYALSRLKKQLQLAKDKNLLSDNEIPNDKTLISTIKHYTTPCKPALLHGDLWSGNYIISTTGVPYLIDPAVYYGHNEVDLAMSKLFGGFLPEFYKAYHSIIPKSEYYQSCMDLYQLFYLLVHLNMFGKSYYGQVKRILDLYF